MHFESLLQFDTECLKCIIKTNFALQDQIKSVTFLSTTKNEK